MAEKVQDSFEISVDDLRRTASKKKFGADLVIQLTDGYKREIGLTASQWQRLMGRIREITDGEIRD